MIIRTHVWDRRAWLVHNAMVSTVGSAIVRRIRFISRGIIERRAAQAVRLESDPLTRLVQGRVDAARTAGARYADARLTRTVGHVYRFDSNETNQDFSHDTEVLGISVRALVDGYWGFAAGTILEPDAVAQLAQDAVAQARTNYKVSTSGGSAPRTVDLGSVPVVTGTWETPVHIDPFTISIEEKFDHILYWKALAKQHGIVFPQIESCNMVFIRQERILGTSEGTLVTQTLYKSGAALFCALGEHDYPGIYLQGLRPVGRGWEIFLDADIPEQLAAMPEQLEALATLTANAKPLTVGSYDLVCDGVTMGGLLASTLGIATQLDRALGYEANATGTSFIDNPLAMVGRDMVAASSVTVTMNRDKPAQLATVKWDDEGVVPEPVTLVHNGVLTGFQTTREQAAWLAPYYAKTGQPVRSSGCAAAEDALMTTLQMMPNLTLEPGPANVQLQDLIANVNDGLLITDGGASTDFQAKNGTLWGTMRRIQNGRLGQLVHGDAVIFHTRDIWKHIAALGGPATTDVIGLGAGLRPESYLGQSNGHGLDWPPFLFGGRGEEKGEPTQATDYSVQAGAALIRNQAVVDIARKA